MTSARAPQMPSRDLVVIGRAVRICRAYRAIGTFWVVVRLTLQLADLTLRGSSLSFNLILRLRPANNGGRLQPEWFDLCPRPIAADHTEAEALGLASGFVCPNSHTKQNSFVDLLPHLYLRSYFESPSSSCPCGVRTLLKLNPTVQFSLPSYPCKYSSVPLEDDHRFGSIPYSHSVGSR
jgi:hypothetical protein